MLMAYLNILAGARLVLKRDDLKKLTPGEFRELLESQGISTKDASLCGRWPSQLATSSVFPIKDRGSTVKDVLEEWFTRSTTLANQSGGRLPHIVLPASPGEYLLLFVNFEKLAWHPGWDGQLCFSGICICLPVSCLLLLLFNFN
jgi:hypothetical protein